MIETIETGSPCVLGLKISGKLHEEDYRQFVPGWETILTEEGRLRLLVQFEDFHGWDPHTAWDDLNFHPKHVSDFERIAVVGDRNWEKLLTSFARPFAQADMKYFDRSEIDAARGGCGKAKEANSPWNKSANRRIRTSPTKPICGAAFLGIEGRPCGSGLRRRFGAMPRFPLLAMWISTLMPEKSEKLLPLRIMTLFSDNIFGLLPENVGARLPDNRRCLILREQIGPVARQQVGGHAGQPLKSRGEIFQPFDEDEHQIDLHPDIVETLSRRKRLPKLHPQLVVFLERRRRVGCPGGSDWFGLFRATAPLAVTTAAMREITPSNGMN